MGTKRLNKNGHFEEIVLHIQVLDRMFLTVPSQRKHSVCHGNKVDYSL